MVQIDRNLTRRSMLEIAAIPTNGRRHVSTSLTGHSRSRGSTSRGPFGRKHARYFGMSVVVVLWLRCRPEVCSSHGFVPERSDAVVAVGDRERQAYLRLTCSALSWACRPVAIRALAASLFGNPGR